MKLRGIIRFLMLLIPVIFILSCDSPEEEDLEFFLFGEYTNTTGANPEFIISDELTDSEVYFDGIIDYEVAAPDIRITMNNLSVYSETENYYIDKVEVEEQVDGEWVWFPEYEVEFGNLTQIGVVLVLDVSESLGNNFDDVLNYAIEFVEIVKANTPEAQIGVVSFSDTISEMPPSTDIQEIENFISNQEMGSYTRMYDAMSIGIEMLTGLLVDGRALVSFTDGWDTFSEVTPDELITEMNDLGIRSYTMGLSGQGGVNTAVLEQLAVNGQYRLTSSKSDLRTIFQFFAQSVSNVYQITYWRSSQKIIPPRQIRYKFTDEQ